MSRFNARIFSRFRVFQCLESYKVKNTIFNRRCLSDPMSVYFNASRDKEYDRGGEEILKYDRMLINAGKDRSL